jgi:hypothetical protein
MKNKILLLLIIIATNFYAQNLDLSALTIPDSLTTNANAVIKLDKTDVNIISQDEMIITNRSIITVLNKYGDRSAMFNEYYDKHHKLKNIKITIYDVLGRAIKKVKKNEIKDVSINDGFSLFNDNRLKYYEYIPNKYPYTVVYSYEIKTSNTAFIPSWYPLKGFYISTLKSQYSLSYPSDFNIKYKEKNLTDFNIQKEKSDHKITYKASSVKAISKEYRNPLFSDFAPTVRFASNKFNLAGVSGQGDNWKDFGQWMYDRLLKNRNELSDDTKNKIKELVKGIEDPMERARLVYEFMQKKTRYISVQIGVGGWKPMLAKEVDDLGYGDCKALVNYTQSLLEEANVEAYYTVVYADDKKNIDKDIVSVQGNHAILYLPNNNKPVWLECTSQTSPFGHIGSFTDDRDVLVVKPTGGEIIHTKIYNDSENNQNTVGYFNIDEEGKITAQAIIKSSGKEYDDHFELELLNEKKLHTYYYDFFDNINNLDLKHIDLSNDKKSIVFTEKIDFEATDFAKKSDNIMFINLNAFNQFTYVPKRYKNRKLPLNINYGYAKEDEVIINLPTNYKIESLGNNVDLKTKFGSLKIVIEKLTENQLKYKRILQIKSGKFPSEDYNEYRKFRKKIVKYDKLKAVLIKK